jgi:hypothetical protein
MTDHSWCVLCVVIVHAIVLRTLLRLGFSVFDVQRMVVILVIVALRDSAESLVQ